MRRVGKVSQPDLERTLNCGVGMVALIAADDADRAVALLAGHGVARMGVRRGAAADGAGGAGGTVVRGQHPGW